MEKMHSALAILQKTGEFLLDLVLPQDPETRTIEKMTAAKALGEFRPARKGEVWIESFFDYKDSLVQKAIWELKYRGNEKIAQLFAEVLCDHLIEEIGELGLFKNFREPLLVPIPLSRERERERGFNQMRLVLEKIDATRLGAEVSYKALQKIKNTKPQTSFSKKSDRLKNLSGAFAANAPEVLDRNIILFDDVLTTGSTLHEARRTLLSAGARDVIAYTLAH